MNQYLFDCLLYYKLNYSIVQNNLLVPLKIRPVTVPYKTEYEEEEKLNFELPLTDNMNTIRLTEMPVTNRSILMDKIFPLI